MRQLHYVIVKTRNNTAGKTEKFARVTNKTLIDVYLGHDSHPNIKSKNGIKVTSSINVDKMSSDQLTAIKKITNIIQEILPIAQTLSNNKFSSITAQDKISILDLYKDMDEKLYILTSINTQTNTMLIKLDKEFDKLFNTVNEGLSRYTPKTNNISGGSIVKHKIDQLYYL